MMMLNNIRLNLDMNFRDIKTKVFVAVCTIVYLMLSVTKIAREKPTVTKTIAPVQPSCKPLNFSSTFLPKTALASFPGSGNTWVRYLLQRASGIYTGSVYDDPYLINHGLPGILPAEKNHYVIAIKTHQGSWPFHKPPDRSEWDRAILIIREPVDALRAEFNRLKAGHTGVPNKQMIIKDSPKYYRRTLPDWYRMNNMWLRSSIPLYIIYYSNLKSNLRKEMQNVFRFLNVTITEADLDCMEYHKEGKFHRNKLTEKIKIDMDETFWKKVEQYKEDIYELGTNKSQ